MPAVSILSHMLNMSPSVTVPLQGPAPRPEAGANTL
jgi:hypothetical protein